MHPSKTEPHTDPRVASGECRLGSHQGLRLEVNGFRGLQAGLFLVVPLLLMPTLIVGKTAKQSSLVCICLLTNGHGGNGDILEFLYSPIIWGCICS